MFLTKEDTHGLKSMFPFAGGSLWKLLPAIRELLPPTPVCPIRKKKNPPAGQLKVLPSRFFLLKRRPLRLLSPLPLLLPAICHPEVILPRQAVPLQSALSFGGFPFLSWWAFYGFFGIY